MKSSVTEMREIMNNGIRLPYVPEYITVHLGRPDANAPNVTVSFSDYIKNVASSEIYPTWPENAIRANILAQISFALNRVYTEYYRSRGYDFDITNSTAFDQSFVNGRDIFDNISGITDEIFNNYIRRRGTVEPLFASYCDGRRVRCDGLSQWGSVDLANRGYTPYQILREYYGNNIELVNDAPVQGFSESYPGRLLRLGSSGNDVYLIQSRLKRIRRNYPSIPEITDADGYFGPDTERAVRKFQSIFSLTSDGIVGRGTWYGIARIYGAVKRVSDLSSEGIPVEDVSSVFDEELSFGDRGISVRELQYLLDFLSLFNNRVPPLTVDGIFGAKTRAAVESFQRASGLPVTGEVRYDDWTRLYSVYRSQINVLPEGFLPEGIVLYPGYPLGEGSEGTSVRALQNYLNAISETYTKIPKINVDGDFGPATRNAVREYQREFGLTPNGLVGAVTWNSIVETYLSLQ